MKQELPQFALLIDADNVDKQTITPIIEEVTRHGRIAVRRIYGDFTTPNLAGWKDKLAEHGIHPVQQYRNTTGKNASDSALIIDAMDLLHSRRFDGFCLVSSDSDFTRLATRIREDGLTVFGFGEKKAPKAFVNACERYIYVENLLAEAEVPSVECDRPDTPVVEKKSVKAPAAPKPLQNVAKPAPASDLAKLKALLLRAYTNVADESGWAMLTRVSQYIHANHSDFDTRSYGASNFIKLVRVAEIFELDERKQGTHFCRPLKLASNSAYVEALKNAVDKTRRDDGWSPLLAIGANLKDMGRTVQESGFPTLSDALMATQLFDMRGTSGVDREFRPCLQDSRVFRA